MNKSARKFALFSVVFFVHLTSSCSGGGGSSEPRDSGVVPSASLIWNEINAGNLTGYRVYFGTSPGRYLQPLGQGINAGSNSNFTVTGLTRQSRYYFVVTGYDSVSGFESGYSNEVFKDIP